MHRNDRQTARRHRVGPFASTLALVAACAQGAGEGPGGLVPPDDGMIESSGELAAVNCFNADVCTSGQVARGQCYSAVTDTTVRREVAQTFNVTRNGKVNFARVQAKKLFVESSGSTAALKVEIRALVSTKVPLDAATTIASGSVLLSAMSVDDVEYTIPLSPAVTLTRNADGTPGYAMVLTVASGVGSVGVACADAGNVYANGTALRRDRVRISGTSFTNPEFSDTSRDLSFAFSLGCDAPTADCDGAGANGCEVNLNTDAVNCGSCGGACSTNNIAQACSVGSCESGTCASGFLDCNANKRTDGCEVNSNTDPNNCGGCGQSCSGNNIALRSCSAGSCQGSACASGFADCNSNKRADGCEQNISTDVLNCGGCGVQCSTNNITRACSSGLCSAGTCAANFGDCNGNKQTDGCETNLTNTLSSCGACGAACPSVANAATLQCASSTCGIQACNSGYFNVDGAYANGCECADDNSAASCAAATSLGTLATGSSLTRDGRVPVTGSSDWYVINFPLNATFQQRGSGTPTVTLTNLTSDVYRFEVYLNSCAASSFQPGATAPPYTTFQYVDSAFGNTASTPGGSANPNFNTAGLCTSVAGNACAYTGTVSSSIAAIGNCNTCGCNYSGMYASYTGSAAPGNFTVAGVGSCNFVFRSLSGVGDYGSRSVEWPSVLYVRVYRRSGAPASGCEDYRLTVSR